MAQTTIRANLTAVQIPLISEEFGRSIIVRQQDINYVPTTASKADPDKDVGIPQAYYAHNVMPTNYGYRSVAYSDQIPGFGVADFQQVIPLVSVSGTKAFIGFTASGAIYVCHAGTGYVWHLKTGFTKALVAAAPTNTGNGYVVSSTILTGSAADTYTIIFTSASAFNVNKNAVYEGSGTLGAEYTSANGLVKFTINGGQVAFVSGDNFTVTLYAATFTGAITHATVSGHSYIGAEAQGVFEYDFTNHTLQWKYAVGLECTGILGICSSNGYLIAYSTTTVAWSSTIDTLDFVPSLSTGAGSGSVEEAKGPIRRCVSLTSGFIVFTAANAVAAIYGQNTRYPFIFREIPNAGGIADLTLVTDEADSTAVYAYTTHGLQQISTQKATLVIPELSDMLTGRRFEDFDSSTLEFTQTNLTSSLKKRVEFISGRFLVVSYGISSFTHAVIYDTALERFGKVKLTHASVFQYGFLDADEADTPRKQIAFVQADGTVKTLDFSALAVATDSVVIIGKFQFIRQRLLQLDSVEVESIEPTAAVDLYTLPSQDGKKLETAIPGTRAGDLTSLSRKYVFRTTAMNHSLLLIGTFRLNSMLLTFNVHGRR